MKFYGLVLALCASFFSLFSSPIEEAFSINSVQCLHQDGSKRTLLFSQWCTPRIHRVINWVANTPGFMNLAYKTSFSHGMCCGYYALNTARCALTGGTREQMQSNALDESQFCDEYLPVWALAIKNRRHQTTEAGSLTRAVANLTYDEVQFLATMLPNRDRLIVLDSLGMMKNLIDGTQKDAAISQAICRSKLNQTPLVCIMNTSKVSGDLWHWFTMVLWPQGSGKGTVDVLDSIASYFGPSSSTQYTENFVKLYTSAL